MVNWKKVAEDDIKKYHDLKTAIENNKREIVLLEEEATSIKAISSSAEIKGSNVLHDGVINTTIKKIELEEILERNIKRLNLIESGLENLSQEERKILLAFYNSCRHNRVVDRLCEELHYEKTRIYEIKNVALHKYILRAYGIVA